MGKLSSEDRYTLLLKIYSPETKSQLQCRDHDSCTETVILYAFKYRRLLKQLFAIAAVIKISNYHSFCRVLMLLGVTYI